MIFQKTPIPGLLVMEIEANVDERGMFARTFDARTLRSAGLASDFPQQSIARNELAGTLRGLHYQVGVEPEVKIVRCTRGAIFDVVVDLRRGSETFGKWVGIDLDERSHRSLYVPAGCAHGYQTTNDATECMYMISAEYRPEEARGVHHADAQLRITWPLPVSCISQRDSELPSLDRADLPT